MKQLENGDTFTNKNMPDHHFEIVGILKDLNICWVEITPPIGYKWIEKDWNLQHTVWGFERGEYVLNTYPVTRDLKIHEGHFTFITVFDKDCRVGVAEETRLKSAACVDLFQACEEMLYHIRHTDFDVCGTSDAELARWKAAIQKAKPKTEPV